MVRWTCTSARKRRRASTRIGFPPWPARRGFPTSASTAPPKRISTGSGCCRTSKDNCPGYSNPIQADFDSDAHGDVCDNCPAVSNTSQTDTDADALGDAYPCTGGVTAACDDNCPVVANPTQADGNANGVGDACE